MEVKVWSHPKFTDGITVPITYKFKPGVTMLIGSNGSGKTTLLKQLYSLFYTDNWTHIEDNNNIRNKYHCYLYDNMYEEKYSKQSWLENDMTHRLADTFENSEGQDMWDFLYYKMEEIGRAVKLARDKNKKGILLLFDGLDSGLSLDKLQKIRTQILDFIITQEKQYDESFEVYIICSANSYEFCNNYECINVVTQQHILFNNYEKYEKYMLGDNNEDK